MALYKEVVFPYGEPDSHSNSSHTVSLGKNDSDAILGSGPSSFSRHARLSRKKDPEKGWVDLCTQLDTEVAAQLEECHKAYAEVTPVYENGQLVQQITRYSDSPEVRIRYYLNEFPTQKANESVFGSFPVTHDHNDLEKHQATEMWVKNCAARDAAFARDNSSTTNSSPYQPRTVRFADEQVSTPPDLVSDTAFAHLSHLSEGELASAYRQQCGKMDASFKKCDVMADFLYNKVESLTAYFNAFDAEARMLQCRQLCPEVYEAAEQLPSMQLQLLNAQHYINDLMEEVKQHKIDAQNSRGFAIRAKEEKKGLQQTFDELTRELYVGFPLNQFSEKQIMNRKIADLEEKLRAKTVECNGKDLMITVLKNEIDQHETNASSYSKENKVLRTQTHVSPAEYVHKLAC